MYFVNPLRTWLGASLLPAVILFTPTMVSGYGERTEMNSPTEETGQKALTVEMKSTSADQQGQQEVIGTVRISQRATGVVIEPALKGLEPGLHGFHIHEGDSCESGRTEDTDTASPSREPAKEAGEHWDPGFKGNHAGPWAQGHTGDLPNLYVDPDGKAITPVYAPRVSSNDFENRALVLHARRDSYSDEEDSAGGSGDAIACGVLDPG